VKDGTVRIGAEDNVPEFLRRYEASLCANCISELLALGDRFSTVVPCPASIMRALITRSFRALERSQTSFAASDMARLARLTRATLG
jgi:hypothetical protein